MLFRSGPGFASDVVASVIYKNYQAGFYGLATAGNVILFVVDASWSMAVSERMTATKGAIMSLLTNDWGYTVDAAELNPNSLEVLTDAKVEPALAAANAPLETPKTVKHIGSTIKSFRAIESHSLS